MKSRDFPTMSDEELERIIASSKNKNTKKSRNFSAMSDEELENILKNNQLVNTAETKLNILKNEHPYLTKFSEMLQNHPYLKQGVEYAGDVGGHIENAIAGTGLPNLAKGAFVGGENVIRGVGNAVIAPIHKFQELVNAPEYAKIPYIKNAGFNEATINTVNPYIQQGAETLGEFGSMFSPASKIQEALSLYEKSLPFLEKGKNVLGNKLSSAISNIASGAATGSLISPDSRILGAVVGGAIPAAIESVSGLKNIGKNAINRRAEINKLQEQTQENKRKFEEAEEKHKLSKEYEQNISQKAGFEHKRSNVEGLKHKSSELYEKLQNALKEHRKIPEEDLNNLLPHPTGEDQFNIEKEQIKKQEFEELKKLEEEKLQKENNYNENENEYVSGIKKSEENLSSVENKLKEQLSRNLDVDTEIYKKIDPILKQEKQQGSKLYDELEGSLKNKKVKFSKDMQDDSEKIIYDATNLIDESNLNPELLARFKKIKNNLKSNNAHDFVAAYRTLRDLAQETRNNAYGKSQQEFDKYIEDSNKIFSEVNKMEELIKSNLSNEPLNKLKEANSYWKNNVIPLYENPVYQYLNKHKRAPENIIKKLSGEAEGSNILKRIIHENPELSRLAIGQNYSFPRSTNLKNLIEQNQLTEKYLESSSDTKIYIKNYEEALKNTENVKNLHQEKLEKIKLDKKNALEEHKSNIENTKQAYKNKINEALLKKEEMTKRAQQVENAFKELKSKQVEREKLEKDIKTIQSKIKSINEKISVLEAARKKTKLTYDEKIKNEINYKESEKKRDLLQEEEKKMIRKSIRIGGALATATVAGYPVVKKFYRFLR